jgi:hypothetical protein
MTGAVIATGWFRPEALGERAADALARAGLVAS